MAKLELFKKQIEDLLKIAKWSPTANQLEEIARQFAKSPPDKSGDALKIVRSFPLDILFSINEGQDNSDLRALLAKAIVLAKEVATPKK